MFRITYQQDSTTSILQLDRQREQNADTSVSFEGDD